MNVSNLRLLLEDLIVPTAAWLSSMVQSRTIAGSAELRTPVVAAEPEEALKMVAAEILTVEVVLLTSCSAEAEALRMVAAEFLAVEVVLLTPCTCQATLGLVQLNNKKYKDD